MGHIHNKLESCQNFQMQQSIKIKMQKIQMCIFTRISSILFKQDCSNFHPILWPWCKLTDWIISCDIKTMFGQLERWETLIKRKKNGTQILQLTNVHVHLKQLAFTKKEAVRTNMNIIFSIYHHHNYVTVIQESKKHSFMKEHFD